MEHINYQPCQEDTVIPYYVRGIGIDFAETDMYRPEGFYRPQFILISEGSGILSVNGAEYPLSAGDVMYLPMNVPHSYRCSSGTWRSWWVIADGYGIEDLLPRFGFTEAAVIRNVPMQSVQRRMRSIYEALEHDKLRGAGIASGEMYALMIELYHALRFDAAERHSGARAVARAADYMEAHYAEQITLSDLAHAADLSEGYLCRLFSQYFHARPIAYLNRLRIQKAKVMLNRSYLSVESVAEACGFENPSYFTKLFRQTEGITPSAYRSMVSI